MSSTRPVPLLPMPALDRLIDAREHLALLLTDPAADGGEIAEAQAVVLKAQARVDSEERRARVLDSEAL